MPRSLLLHPVALASLVVLVVNDHWLKAAWPGPVTGKLSDIAGLVLFPLLLVELARLAGRRPPVALAAAATALAFAWVKTTVAGAWTYATGLGTAQWLLSGAWLRGEPPVPVQVVRDPTDLLAIPVVLVAVWVARQRRPASVAPRGGPRVPARMAGPVVALLAAVACLATSQAAPAVTDEARVDAVLAPDAPVAVYRVDWALDLGGRDANEVSLGAIVNVDGGRASDLEVILVGDDGLPDVGMSGAATPLAVGGCDPACSGTARIVVHAPFLAEGADPLDATIEAWARASFGSESDTENALVDLELARDDGFATAPSTAAATAQGEVTARSDRPGTARLVLHVSEAALQGGRGWPLVGVLDLEARLPVPAPETWFSAELQGLPDAIATGDGESVSAEVLSGCPARGPCAIPVELIVVPTSGEDVDGAPAEVDVRWSMTLRLEAFDGRALPEDAVRIEVR